MYIHVCIRRLIYIYATGGNIASRILQIIISYAYRFLKWIVGEKQEHAMNKKQGIHKDEQMM